MHTSQVSRTRKLRETPRIGSLLVLSGPEGQVSLSPCFDSQIGKRVHALARKRGPSPFLAAEKLDSRLRGNERRSCRRHPPNRCAPSPPTSSSSPGRSGRSSL